MVFLTLDRVGVGEYGLLMIRFLDRTTAFCQTPIVIDSMPDDRMPGQFDWRAGCQAGSTWCLAERNSTKEETDLGRAYSEKILAGEKRLPELRSQIDQKSAGRVKLEMARSELDAK